MCINITITFKFTTALLLPGTFIMLPFPFGDKAKLKLKHEWIDKRLRTQNELLYITSIATCLYREGLWLHRLSIRWWSVFFSHA